MAFFRDEEPQKAPPSRDTLERIEKRLKRIQKLMEYQYTKHFTDSELIEWAIAQKWEITWKSGKDFHGQYSEWWVFTQPGYNCHTFTQFAAPGESETTDVRTLKLNLTVRDGILNHYLDKRF